MQPMHPFGLHSQISQKIPIAQSGGKPSLLRRPAQNPAVKIKTQKPVRPVNTRKHGGRTGSIPLPAAAGFFHDLF